MEKLQLYRCSLVEWRPSAVVSLAVSPDGALVAAARADGSLEIWNVSPGSVGWHCQLTIQGNPDSRVSSLVWCRPSSRSRVLGRLLSSSIDGSISEWDLLSLQQKIVLDSVGVSIWQMALEPSNDALEIAKHGAEIEANAFGGPDPQSDVDSGGSDDEDSTELLAVSGSDDQRLAVACDDGCVRIYNASDTDGLTYKRSFPRVSGRILSVTWSLDTKLVFGGSSDGLIRCWDARGFHEVYRITVGVGRSGSGTGLCVWSLLFLRSRILVSGDSTGSVQFWDSHHGTLLQSLTYHKGDVNALATIPSHNRVFSAGSDGQVVLYKLSSHYVDSEESKHADEEIKKWVYIGYTRAHTHDVRALAVATPISSEDLLPDEKVKKKRRLKRAITFSYKKWAQVGVPMLISSGDDTKIFAYSAREFTQFSPHDVCPAPQRPKVQLVYAKEGASLLLVQGAHWLDIMQVKPSSNAASSMSSRRIATTQLVRVKSNGSRKMICSTISSCGLLFAYSDHVGPRLFELKRNKDVRNGLPVKMKLPCGLPFAHSMVFAFDSSSLMLAGQDRKIYVVDVKRSVMMHTFVPHRKEDDAELEVCGPPITKMFVSSDGKWLAASNCYGDIYVFDLEVNRQHWFISRLNNASVTAGGFSPTNSSVLVITTSANEVYVFNVDSKSLGEWSRCNSSILPRQFREFPGEILGLCFPPSDSTYVVVYSARAMCLIDFGMPVDCDSDLPNGYDLLLEKFNIKKTLSSKKKRKTIEQLSKYKTNGRRNFDFCAFRDPALFVGYLADNSLLVLEKTWLEVVQNFDAPVHRHIFGT